MAANFHHMQLVKTPKGKAVFLGYMGEGLEAQVSRIAGATEFSRDECIRRRRAVEHLSDAEFKQWQKTADFNVNEIYAVELLEPVGR